MPTNRCPCGCESWIKINESRDIALFWVSGSIIVLSLIDFVNIYLLSIFFFNSFCHYLSFLNFFSNRFCRVEESGVTPHCLYRDSLTLSHASKANLKLIIPLLIQRESVIQISMLLSRIYHGL